VGSRRNILSSDSSSFETAGWNSVSAMISSTGSTMRASIAERRRHQRCSRARSR
jgi:hypothetical protein